MIQVIKGPFTGKFGVVERVAEPGSAIEAVCGPGALYIKIEGISDPSWFKASEVVNVKEVTPLDVEAITEEVALQEGKNIRK